MEVLMMNHALRALQDTTVPNLALMYLLANVMLVTCAKVVNQTQVQLELNVLLVVIVSSALKIRKHVPVVLSIQMKVVNLYLIAKNAHLDTTVKVLIVRKRLVHVLMVTIAKQDQLLLSSTQLIQVNMLKRVTQNLVIVGQELTIFCMLNLNALYVSKVSTAPTLVWKLISLIVLLVSIAQLLMQALVSLQLLVIKVNINQILMH